MPAEHAESVFARLEPLLPQVQKPIQYVGGELNSTSKAWGDAEVRWALMYPDAYEVGLPNQGVAILYEVLNERDWVLAERTYAVWPDMERVMRDGDAAGPIPQFTVDSHRPVRAFDVLGVSFSTELGYTNLLNALDLAGIPIRATDRGEDDPHRAGRRARRVQPRADRRLHRRRRPRRRRGGRAGDLRGDPGVEVRGPARRPGSHPARGAAAPAGGLRWRLRAPVLRRRVPRRTGASAGSCRTSPTFPGGWPSTP